MDNDIYQKKIDQVKKWFNNHFFIRYFEMKLSYVNRSAVMVTMPLSVDECTDSRIVTGGVHAIIGNAAGVTLAMMHSEHFTPLAEIKSLKFYKPIRFKKDGFIIARAKFLEIKKNRIIVKVTISSDSGDSDKLITDLEEKAEGIFEYAILSEDYRTS